LIICPVVPEAREAFSKALSLKTSNVAVDTRLVRVGISTSAPVAASSSRE